MNREMHLYTMTLAVPRTTKVLIVCRKTRLLQMISSKRKEGSAEVELLASRKRNPLQVGQLSRDLLAVG